MVGVSHGSFRTLYRAGTDDCRGRQYQDNFEHDEWKQRRKLNERENILSRLFSTIDASQFPPFNFSFQLSHSNLLNMSSRVRM